MDELEDIQWTDETVDLASVCEVCFWEDYTHADGCVLDPENSMIDEEVEYMEDF